MQKPTKAAMAIILGFVLTMTVLAYLVFRLPEVEAKKHRPLDGGSLVCGAGQKNCGSYCVSQGMPCDN